MALGWRIRMTKEEEVLTLFKEIEAYKTPEKGGSEPYFLWLIRTFEITIGQEESPVGNKLIEVYTSIDDGFERVMGTGKELDLTLLKAAVLAVRARIKAADEDSSKEIKRPAMEGYYLTNSGVLYFSDNQFRKPSRYDQWVVVPHFEVTEWLPLDDLNTVSKQIEEDSEQGPK